MRSTDSSLGVPTDSNSPCLLAKSTLCSLSPSCTLTKLTQSWNTSNVTHHLLHWSFMMASKSMKLQGSSTVDYSVEGLSIKYVGKVTELRRMSGDHPKMFKVRNNPLMPSTVHTLRHLICDSPHGASRHCTFGGGVMSGFAPQTLSPLNPLDDAPMTPMPH